MSTITQTTGFEALALVHPQHAERINAAHEAMTAGAVVEFEVTGLTDAGTFFTGVRSGDRVVVTEHRAFGTSVSRTVQVVEADAAHLSINASHTLTAVDPNALSVVEAKAAQAAATKAATHEMERALCSANGLLGAPAGDEAALTALRAAHDLRNLAFAYGVLADWIDGLARRDGYHVNTLARSQAR